MDVVEGPGERPRRGWGVGVVAVLLLAAGLYGATRPDRPAPEARPSPAPTGGDPSPDGPGGTPRPSAVGGWELPALTEPTGVTLAGPSDGLLVLDLDSGRTRTAPVPDEFAQTVVEPVAAVPGGWLVARRPFCDNAPCEPAVFWVLRGKTAKQVGTGDTAHPDPDGRTFWLTTLPARPGDPRIPPRTLERRTYEGAVVGPRTTLRRFEEVVAVSPNGPVVGSRVTEAPITVIRAGDRTRRVVTPEGRPVAASSAMVAWTLQGCRVPGTTPCRLVINELEAYNRIFDEGWGGDVEHAALDPTGRYFAVTAQEAPGTEAVHVHDLRGGPTHVLSLTVPPRPDSMTWAPDGRHLVMTREVFDEQEIFQGHQVAVWRRDTGEVALAAVYPGASGGTFAVGPAR